MLTYAMCETAHVAITVNRRIEPCLGYVSNDFLCALNDFC